jgi:transposase
MVLQQAVFPGVTRMQLKTILNQVERHKSFVYGKAKFVKGGGRARIEIPVSPRKNSRPVCSKCRRPGPGYDRLPVRRFEFVPLWNIAVFFLYSMRRVDCGRCGVTVERVPWGDGKSQHTRSYQWFLALWAKRLSWQGVAVAFGTTWEHVRNAVQYAVFWGLARRKTTGIKSVGVDEIAWRKGHNYLTLVYQLDEGRKRLLWAAAERTEESLRPFFELVLPRGRRTLRFVCSDMWQPYLNVIREQAPQALHVLDRFHVMSLFNKALDKIRAEESRRMQRDGYEPVLKHSRWCLLKRPDNLTDQQTVKLRELLQYNLQSVRAYLQREDFQRFLRAITVIEVPAFSIIEGVMSSSRTVASSLFVVVP